MDFFAVDFCTDYADSSDDSCAAYSYIRFARYIVEVNPLTILAFYDTLCTEHETVFVFVFKCCENFCNLFH